LGFKKKKQSKQKSIQGVFESCAEILTTSYWLHVELGKNILKILSKKKMTFIGVRFIKHDIQGCIFKMCLRGCGTT
jgi:hypothetical protein